MINAKNFQNLLKLLGFIENNSIYSKKFEIFDCELRVDFKTKEIIYPENRGLIVNDKTTSNFDSNENFVVFEAVHRLLMQGYHPKHIELEKKWQLGHTSKSGKADIVVKDNRNQIILIIECKTAGGEYKKAINILENDSRNQLFSYLQQAPSAKFLALYASDFVDNKIVYDYYLINVKDNEELLANNPTLKSYKEAKSVEEKYLVWRDTYKKEYATIGLFENNQAYEIGKNRYSIDDLKSVSSRDIQGKYHQFATILRQHNISGRENAFDKLVNLFLCKVTDEIENPTNLKFYYKGMAYDDPFSFQDRLQELYKIGMEKFLDDKIVYIGNSQIDEAFGVFKERPNVTKDLIKEYFKELKFFTNSDFAFIDVHNEKLFYQNFEVLLKIAQTFQDMRLTSSEENQFLGDMFEGFLDQGVKQSEGQFFTPMPIVKFIISSLPKREKPKVCDYACGAGHFLNEYANINRQSQIVGIEKEYRLSKVAKVSSFMYGHDMQIIYADALKQNSKIEEKSFDVIISNPPYSVKGFLSTLKSEDRERFELTDDVDSKSYAKTGAIECFFIERTKQLLDDGGVSAIIVPSSILNKDTPKLYTTTREIVLKYFEIIAIAEFGSGTFGKTGTNTVTLFLRKREGEYLYKHFQNMIACWFEGDFAINQAFKDESKLQNYCEFVEIDFACYKKMLCYEFDERLFSYEIFVEYKNSFEKSSLFKELKKKKYFKELSKEEQESKIQKELIKYIKRIEKEKLLYFMLATTQKNRVVIIKSPTNNNKIKKFLGYEWSNRKGDEGIKYLTKEAVKVDDTIDEEDKKVLETLQGIKYIDTPLYNPQNLEDNTKINKIIKENFEKGEFKILDELKEYVSSADLVDMLDFSRVEFNKAFTLSPAKKVEIKSRWELVRLGEKVAIKGGNTFPEKYQNHKKGVPFFKVSDMNIKENIPLMKIANNYVEKNILLNEIKGYIFPKNTIIFPKVGKAIETNKKRILSIESAIDNNVMGLIIKDNDSILYKYLFEYFNNFINLIDIASTANPPSISAKNLESIKIPLPPLDIQEKIVEECESIDKIDEKLRVENEKLKEEIGKIINSINGENTTLEAITQNLDHLRKPVAKNRRRKGIYPYYGASGIVDYVDDYILDDFVLLISEDGANLKSRNTPIAFSAKGKIWVNNHAHILKFNNISTHKLVEYYLNSIDISLYITGQAQPKLSQKNLNKIKIPLPPLTTQKEIVRKIEKIEEKMKKNKNILNESKAKKEEVLRKYL